MRDCVLPTHDVLTDEQIGMINENSFVIRYRKGQVICHQDHPVSHVFFLKSGMVKVFNESYQDRKSIIGIISPGHFFSIMSVFESKLFLSSASAIQDSEVHPYNCSCFSEPYK